MQVLLLFFFLTLIDDLMAALSDLFERVGVAKRQ